MNISVIGCPSCGYSLTEADLVYGNCPACGSDVRALNADGDSYKVSDAMGLTDINDKNGRLIAKAKLPRGFTSATATMTVDNSDRIRPNKLTVISKSVIGDTLFYKSGETFVQVKSGLYNDAKGEFAKDMSARKKAFKSPSAYLDEMAVTVTGAKNKMHVQFTRDYPIEDMENTRNIFLNASINDLKNAQNMNHGSIFNLLDFYFDALIKVYSYEINNTVKYLTLGTVIRGDEVSMKLTANKDMAQNLRTTQGYVNTAAKIVNSIGGGRRRGIFSLPGTINMVNGVLNSGIIDHIDNNADKPVSMDDKTVALSTATDGSNEGFGTRMMSGAKCTYISWCSDCLVGMITENRPDGGELADFEEFITSFTYLGKVNI